MLFVLYVLTARYKRSPFCSVCTLRARLVVIRSQMLRLSAGCLVRRRGMRRYPRLDNVENRRGEMSMDWNINSKHVRLSSTRRPFLFGSEDSGDDFGVRLREYGTATGNPDVGARLRIPRHRRIGAPSIRTGSVAEWDITHPPFKDASDRNSVAQSYHSNNLTLLILSVEDI